VLRIRIRDPVPFLTPGPGTRIPNPYFFELSDKFLGKRLYNSLKTWSNFFLQYFKNKIILSFVKFVATKKRYDNNFFSHPFLLLGFLDPGSEIRDKNPGSATLD
jgi:hypothetical protein